MVDVGQLHKFSAFLREFYHFRGKYVEFQLLICSLKSVTCQRQCLQTEDSSVRLHSAPGGSLFLSPGINNNLSSAS